MKAEVQIVYLNPETKEKKFLSIRLKNLAMNAVKELIDEKLKELFPKEDNIEYTVINIS